MRLLRVLTWNVHKCLGSDGRRDVGRVLSVIAGISPDVVALQEADLRFGRKRALLDKETVLRETGLEICLPGDSRAQGWHGNMLLATPGIRCISGLRLALPSLEPRGALLCRLSCEGIEFDLVGMHLGLIGSWRRLQVVEIASLIAGRQSVPTIVAGDTNDWRVRSRTMAPLELVLGSSCRRVRTFPSSRPVLSLDRIMAGRGAEVCSMRPEDAREASDHIPLLSEVALRHAA